VSVKVKVDEKKLNVLTNTLSQSQLGEILDGVGALLVSKFQSSWRKRQSPSGESWPARMVPNVPGIVADLNKGGDPKGRRFEEGQPLVDTGRLRGSLTWEVRGRVLSVGTSVSYAALHNEGGETTHTLNATGRRQLTLWLRRERRGAGDPAKLGLGWLFGKPTFSVNVQKRTFIEVGQEEDALIKGHVESEIRRLVR